MRVLFIIVVLMGAVFIGQTQELNVSVTINTPKLQTVDPQVFQTLETGIEEFMNNQKWTTDVFEQDERIQVQIQLTVTEEVSATSFKGEMTIQAVRPVFGSDYESPLMTHRDEEVSFTYEQFQPIEFSENKFTTNLSAILSYYTFIILGMDYDSFSSYGGETYFQKAQEIVNMIPPSAAAQHKGWTSLSSRNNRNRYWLIENILAPRVRPYRTAMYNYHRQGLDMMHKDPAAGRASIIETLQDLEKVNNSYPNSMILQMFATSKDNEIIEIFKGASSREQTVVVQIMRKLDAANSSKYQNIQKRG